MCRAKAGNRAGQSSERDLKPHFRGCSRRDLQDKTARPLLEPFTRDVAPAPTAH